MDGTFLQVGLDAVTQARERLRLYYRTPRAQDPAVDKEVEQLIKNIILKTFPEHSFDGEETGLHKGLAPYTWYCDPLSASSNFIRNLPFFAVSLALFDRTKPVLGIVCDPVTGDVFHAIIGSGAYVNGKRITPSSQQTIKDAYFAGSFKKNASGLLSIIKEGASSRMFGSWALHFAYTAAGLLDFAYTEVKDVYGVVAGLVIAQEAGCYFFDGTKDNWDLQSRNILVTSTRKLLDSVKGVLTHHA